MPRIVTPAEIEDANQRAESYMRENCPSTPQRFRFGEISHGGARCFVEDDEGEIAFETNADAIYPGALVAINIAYERGRQHGDRYGRWAARSEMRLALGIDAAFLRDMLNLPGDAE